ncbi:MAG: STAS/SEC14 domain-containing protein [Bacteroidales bacterium]|nr:STAS/SEC14 domain-containing protein [Bacteroidales bacterium]
MGTKEDSVAGIFSYKVFKDKKFCEIKGEGKVNFNDSLNAMIALVKDPDFQPDFAILADIKDLDYHPTYDELMSLKDRLVFLKHNFKNKIALVTSDKLFVIVEVVTVFSRIAGIKINSFTKMEKAQSWLAEK